MTDAPPITREQAWIRRYRGEGMVLFRAVVRASLRNDQWEALLAEVGDEARAYLEKPASLDTWVDATVIQAVLKHLEWMDAMRLGGVPGTLSAEHQMIAGHDAWSSPAALLAHMADQWAERVDGGRVVVESVGEGSARIALWADTLFHYYFRTWIPAWLRKALERTGARGVRVVYEPPVSSTPYLHRYDVTWD